MNSGDKHQSFIRRIHVEPAISLGHILTTIGLIVAGLWWAADIYTRVEINSSAIRTNAALIRDVEQRSNINIAAAADLAERGRQENKEYLQRIEDKVDRLIERQAEND